MEEIISTVTEATYLFSLDLNKEILLNIGSGKGASKEVTLFILHVTDTGKRVREDFIKACKKTLVGLKK